MPKTPAADRFMALVDRKSEGCWKWLGCVNPGGCVTYGMFWLEGKSTSAHRAAWRIFKGSIPKGMSVCHTCDDGLCVNPDHLFIGSALDNARDMQCKGRHRYGYNVAKGTAHYRSKLSADQVLAIRRDIRKHKFIASDYGINKSQVSRIQSLKRYTSI